MISTLVLLLLPLMFSAEWESTIPEVLDRQDPLDSKELALAKFEVRRADVKSLRQARLDQVRSEAQDRFKEFLAGRGNQYLLLEALRRLVGAEAAVEGDEAALRRHWELAWVIEQVSQARFDAGRIPIQDLAQSRTARLDAELRLSQDQLRLSAVSNSPTGFTDISSSEIMSAKKLSQALAGLRKTRPVELRQARLAALRVECEARFKQFLAGQGDLDILMEALRHRLESERVLASTKAEQTVAIERLWEVAYQIEAVNRQRHEAGRMPTKVWLESRALRTEAELMLIDARGGAGARVAGSAGLSALPVESNPLDAKDQARAKFAAFHAKPADLLRAWRADLEAAYDSRARSFLAGQGTLDVLLAITNRCREAELALAPNEAARRLAFERCWTRTWQCEQVNQARYLAGRIPSHHLAQTRAARLDSEIAWLEALR